MGDLAEDSLQSDIQNWCSSCILPAVVHARRPTRRRSPGSVSRRRECSQYEAPPQSRQWVRTLPCEQTDAPPQSRHCDRRRECSQIDAPPQSRRVHRSRPCPQKDDPPQSRHIVHRRPCGHFFAGRRTRAIAEHSWCFLTRPGERRRKRLCRRQGV